MRHLLEKKNLELMRKHFHPTTSLVRKYDEIFFKKNLFFKTAVEVTRYLTI